MNLLLSGDLDLSDIWPPDEYTPICAAIGRLTFHWNNAETAVASLVQFLVQNSEKVRILTTHMSNMALTDALKTLAEACLEGDEKEHVLFVDKIFNRYREYRNFYIHGFKLVGVTARGVPTARLVSTSARSKFVAHNLDFKESDILAIVAGCAEMTEYLRKLSHYGAYKWHPERSTALPPTLPEKPPLPDRLTKPRRDLLSELLPPGSSQA
ncbi:MAG: hypothetical protein RLN70_06180 [Rhodospirillaceae bacterium]